MNGSLFIFQADTIDSSSVTEHSSGTNLDFFAVPTENLTSISALENQIVLYFKESNVFENSKANQARVVLNTKLDAEKRATVEVWSLTRQLDKIYQFNNVTKEYPVDSIVSVASIIRPTTERFISSGGSLPPGGNIDQVLTKLSSTDGDADWLYPHTLFITVRNTSGGTLAKGTPVHATGVTGTVPDVIAADASNSSAMPATYVLNESIANNAQGVAIIVGTITGVDTSAFSAGDVVYVASGGGFTNVKPTGTNLIQNLGVVTRSNLTTGSGVVYGAGRSNDVPNLPTGKFFIGSSTNTQESAYTLPTADGTSGQVLATDGSGAVTFKTILTQVTSVTVLQASWSLVSGLYEYDISDANILSTSIVDVIPANADYATVVAAQLLPENVSSSGQVKIFAVNQPTVDFDVTLNIFN